MSIIKLLEDDDQLERELISAGNKLVVVYYTAMWCAPCKKMKPVFDSLSKKYQGVIFLTLDVDTCQETAIIQGVTALPTFVFHRNTEKVDIVQGADPIALEKKIDQYVVEMKEPEVSGHIDLTLGLRDPSI